MKTKILTLIAILAMFALSSCKKEENKDFDYQIEQIHGTWQATEIYISDTTQIDSLLLLSNKNYTKVL